VATALRFTIDPAQKRNARLSLQNRLEGLITLLDDPVVIEEGSNFLEVELPDALPTEELQAALRTLANLVNRPESGILSAATVTPAVQEDIPRVYSA